jgi:hypothetical protein
MTTKLLRVAAKHLVAGIDVERGIVTHTAPILKWALGLTEAEFRERCAYKAWQVDEVPV